jgi:hypothetical protein
MNERSERLLEALRTVSKAGATLEPSWNPHAREGFAYHGNGSSLDDEQLREDLEELARDGYVEHVFVDRLSLCPHCESHALNVREVCLSCSSSRLKQVKVLFHFRCGYVGAVSSYAAEPQGRRCPKCAKLLQDLGADHDSPGDYFSCLACNAMFQVPEIGARCLCCGTRLTGIDMQRIGQRDVFAYRLLARGEAAVSAGRLLDA